MSEQTKIEWADATWNPWVGCTEVSPGCAHCYAKNSPQARVLRARGVETWGCGGIRQRTTERYWKLPLRWNRAAKHAQVGWVVNGKLPRVFPSLCDWLDEDVPIEWLRDFLILILQTPFLRWQLQTKRPGQFVDRLTRATMQGHNDQVLYFWAKRWLQGYAPPNVWVGTSVEDQPRADERIPALLKIPARVRFLSVEPLLGPVNLGIMRHVVSFPKHIGRDGGVFDREHLPFHWVIVGGESGPKARPCNVAWMRDILRQCKSAGVPCFVKQLGSNPMDNFEVSGEFPALAGLCGVQLRPLRLKHPKGGDPSEWPFDLRVRKWPEVEV